MDKKNVMLYSLAIVVVVGFFVLTGTLLWVPLPDGSPEAIFMLFGALATGFGTVLQYFFGSSKSSADKTELMNGKKTN